MREMAVEQNSQRQDQPDEEGNRYAAGRIRAGDVPISVEKGEAGIRWLVMLRPPGPPGLAGSWLAGDGGSRPGPAQEVNRARAGLVV